MTPEQKQRIEQIEDGDQPWRKTAYELGDVIAGHESDVDFLLSLVQSQEAERILPHWSEPPHDCTAFNGLLEPLAHALSSITSETKLNVRVPHPLAEKVWSELWQVERGLLAIQEQEADAASMRSACVEKVKSMQAYYDSQWQEIAHPEKGGAITSQSWQHYSNAAQEIITTLESVSIREQEK